jgi:hypothetical protein
VKWVYRLSRLRERDRGLGIGLGRDENRALARGVGLLTVLDDVHAQRLLVSTALAR